MPAILIRYPDGTEQEQELAGQLTIGRADGNDLVLAEGGVSRQHARFFTEGPEVLVEDKGSANGTFVDGEKISGPTKVGPRAQVVIGDYEIKLKGNGAANGKSKPAGARAPGKGPTPGPGGVDRTTAQKVIKPPRATKMVPAVKADPAAGAALAKRTRPTAQPNSGPVLRGLTGPFMNKSFPIKGTMVVGRVAGVDIQLEDDSVSRRHAELVLNGKSVVLRDLGSANGTTVNGQPLTDEANLQPGDIIQFGVVEMAYENGGDAAGGRLPARRPGGRPAPVGRKPDADDEAAFDAENSQTTLAPGKKKLLIGIGIVMTLAVAGLVAYTFKAPPPNVGPVGPGPGPQPIGGDPLEENLSACRQFSSVELGEPNWEKAESACRKVLELEPIHVEANQLLAKIKIERNCEDNFLKGKKLLQRNHEDEAVDTFGKIKPNCSYYIKVIPLVKEALEGVKKHSLADCKEYTANGKIAEALIPCEQFMKIACQSMKPEDLYPPALKNLNISGSMRKNDWRPKDPMYLNFLRAREKADPNAPAWKCPVIEIIDNHGGDGPKPLDNAKKVFESRYKGELAFAHSLYFEGKATEGVAMLTNKVENNMEKASMHAEAKALRKQLTNVEQLYKDGQGELANNRPDKAEEPFREALGIDEELVLGENRATLTEEAKKKELEKMNSYYRHNIQQDMASACYTRGKEFADRKDMKLACKAWKLGFSFWKGNSDLLRAVTNVCTQEAARRLESAGSCQDLASVLEFAVDGDGHKEQVEKKKGELNCPP